MINPRGLSVAATQKTKSMVTSHRPKGLKLLEVNGSFE